MNRRLSRPKPQVPTAPKNTVSAKIGSTKENGLIKHPLNLNAIAPGPQTDIVVQTQKGQFAHPFSSFARNVRTRSGVRRLNLPERFGYLSRFVTSCLLA